MIWNLLILGTLPRYVLLFRVLDQALDMKPWNEVRCIGLITIVASTCHASVKMEEGNPPVYELNFIIHLSQPIFSGKTWTEIVNFIVHNLTNIKSNYTHDYTHK